MAIDCHYILFNDACTLDCQYPHYLSYIQIDSITLLGSDGRDILCEDGRLQYQLLYLFPRFGLGRYHLDPIMLHIFGSVGVGVGPTYVLFTQFNLERHARIPLIVEVRLLKVLILTLILDLGSVKFAFLIEDLLIRIVLLDDMLFHFDYLSVSALPIGCRLIVSLNIGDFNGWAHGLIYTAQVDVVCKLSLNILLWLSLFVHVRL